MNLPPIMLLLGTDAAGKNHVARVWAERLKAEGRSLEVREGWLNGPRLNQQEEDVKGGFALFAELVFIRCFPLLKLWLPWVLKWLIDRDCARFRAESQPLLVVSYRGLRLLAFCLGQNRRFLRNKRLSARLEASLHKLRDTMTGVTFVLDVDPQTRQNRIKQRCAQGRVDPFDRFMLADMQRSERIEACLVWLAQRYLGAQLIENNDLSDDALWMACRRGLGAA